MSVSSYRKNVWLGVTNKDTDTCYPAALEQISPGFRLDPSTYAHYRHFIGSFDRMRAAKPYRMSQKLESLIGEITLQLGCEPDDVRFERVDTYREFSNCVRTFLRHDYRVAVDLSIEGVRDEAHPVGLVQYDEDSFKLVSNWVPLGLGGFVTKREIFENMDFANEPFRIRYPFNAANITALPPAA